jgi:signal peptidase I
LKQAINALSLLLILVAGVGFAFAYFQDIKLFSVQSGSMVPSLEKGDLVAVTRVPEGQLAVGDVVTFVNPANKNQTITHRIVETPSDQNQQRFITKGDANSTVDESIAPESIVGTSSFSLPYIGHLVDFIRHPVGLILLIYIPALLIVVSEIRRLTEYYRKTQPYFASKSVQLRSMRRRKKNKGLLAFKTFGLVMVAGSLIYLPVSAMLSTSAVLGGNTITTIPITPQPSQQVLFRQITLRCSVNNASEITNIRPEIVLYNPTKENINIGNWTLRDNSGTIITFPNGQILKKKHKLKVTPLLVDGLQYAGDNLRLFNSVSQPVDALSWGSDTSAFNPSITTPKEGTRLKRKQPKLDTNTSSDWRVSDHKCQNRDDPDDDHNECSEIDRTTVRNMYHLEEFESSDNED